MIMSTRSSTILDGRYAVGPPIATGGYSVVYQGEDLRFGTPVALKILKDGGDRDAFRREARLARQFEHPHAVRVLDFGPGPQDTDTPPYLVMELLRGQTLKELSRTVSGSQIRQFVEEIGGALAFAHERGLAHRDFKPQNVLVDCSGTGVRERFVLIDFGISAQFEGTRSLQNHAADGLGTAPYMSPEQWRGEANHRADIYAFGCVVYELLSGTVPFPATGFPGTREQYVTHVCTARAPALRAAAPFCPVSDSIERLLASCLEKSPSKRPASLAAFIGPFLADFDAGSFDRYRNNQQSVVFGATTDLHSTGLGHQPTSSRPIPATVSGPGDGLDPERFHRQTELISAGTNPSMNSSAGQPAASLPAHPGFNISAGGVGAGGEPSRDTHAIGENTVKSGSHPAAPATRVPKTSPSAAPDVPAPVSVSAPPVMMPGGMGEPDPQPPSRTGATVGKGRLAGPTTPVAWSVPVVGGTGVPSPAAPLAQPLIMDRGTAATLPTSRGVAAVDVRATSARPPVDSRGASVSGKARHSRLPILEIAAALLAIAGTASIALVYRSAQNWEHEIRNAIQAGDMAVAISRLDSAPSSARWLSNPEAVRGELRTFVLAKWKSLLAAPIWADGDLRTLQSIYPWLLGGSTPSEWSPPLQQAAELRVAELRKQLSLNKYAEAEAVVASPAWSWLNSIPEARLITQEWSHSRILAEWGEQELRDPSQSDLARLRQLAARLDSAMESLSPESSERTMLWPVRQRVESALMSGR